MTKRPHHELQRASGCNTSHAEFILSKMEAAASCDGQAHHCIAGKWLSIFRDEAGELAYNWQGGYPTSAVSRRAALSVLVHA